MAERDNCEDLLLRMRRSMPCELLLPISQMQFGAGAALQYLYDHRDRPVSAGELSQFLRVSSARVAALLRKLTSSTLIVKEKAAYDGRVTVVRLSDRGIAYVEQHHQELEKRLHLVVDQIGMENLEEFMELGILIRQCMNAPPLMEL